MTCAIRTTMNEFFAQKLAKSKQDSIYSPLTDDMEVMEATPVKVSSPVRKPCRPMVVFSRRLFSKSNKTFKMNKRNSPMKNKLGRIRNLFQTFQNKLQVWTQEIRDSAHESKTPNFTTPNRRTRRILGRTPEPLYSPFGIETPPSHFKSRPATEIMEYPFSAFHNWVTPSKRKQTRAKSKIVTNLFY